MLLTWLGAQPAEEPFIKMSLVAGLGLVIREELEQLLCDFYVWYDENPANSGFFEDLRILLDR